MSLINQMLKDLESRRGPDSSEHSVLAGIGGSGRRTQQRGLLIGLLVAILVLGAVMAYLLWQQRNEVVSQAPGVNPALAMNAPKASPAAEPTVTRTPEKQSNAGNRVAPPETPVLVKKQSTVSETAVTTAPPAGITLPEDEPAPVTDTTRFTPADPPSYPVAEQAPIADMRIEKRIRPLRPAQIAEKQYQDGYARIQKGDQDGAEVLWRKALETDPAHIASREALSALYLSQARRVEAAEQLQQGLEYHPGNGRFALLYARLLMENGNNAAAIAAMERALQEAGQNADFYAFLAAIYQREKAYDKSVAAYQRALNQQPRQSLWWMGIGISLEGAGKRPEALTAYREAKDNGNLPPRLLQYVEGRITALE